MQKIRLVTFDALHTIITPRYPIYDQYAQVFRPYLGALPPGSIKRSFAVALKAVQKEHPSYNKGATIWWSDVIRRTALGAGGDEQAFDTHELEIVSRLMTRFSSREGYKAFDDAISTINVLNGSLGIRTSVLSNGDSRIRSVLEDLGFPETLRPIVLSEEEGVEKPSSEIFMKTLAIVNGDEDLQQNPIQPTECLHVGDKLVCDYNGAINSGWNALLLRRAGLEGEHEHKGAVENLADVNVIRGLNATISWVKHRAVLTRG